MTIANLLAKTDPLELILGRAESERDRQSAASNSARDAMGGMDLGSLINAGLEHLLGGLLSKSG